MTEHPKSWRPLWLLARAPQPEAKQAPTKEIDMMNAIMQETIEEVTAHRKARLQKLPTAAGGGDTDSSDSTDDNDSGGLSERQPDVRRGLAGGYMNRRPQADERPEEGGPNSSPWGRRALGDDWYDSRCIRCSACNRDVSATVRAKRGVRCSGCLRWVHDGCAPQGTLPTDKAKRECDAFTSDYFHCAGCQELRERLQQGAQALCGKELAGGCRVTLVDLHNLRQQLKPRDEEADKQAKQERPAPAAARTSAPFQRIAKEELRVMKKLKTLPSQAAALAITGNDLDDIDGTAAPASTAGDQASKVQSKVVQRLGGLSDLKSIVGIFKHGSGEPLEDVLEDSWAAVMRCGEAPVTAASVLVLGSDHARLQALVTEPHARRQGHARVLASELQEWLRQAGVPRMVAVLSQRQVAGPRQEDGGESILRRLGFSTLQDLETLGIWKEVWFPYYTRDLIGRSPRVLIRNC